MIGLAGVAVSAAMTSVHAQFGGRQRSRGESPLGGTGRGDQNPRAANPALADPIVAIERELPSLRTDLKLTTEQSALFDSFEREVRDAADAGRLRPRHLSALRTDDGSSVAATKVFNTIADDDAQRAEATRHALETLQALVATLTPEQQRQFDRRIIQSLREPLGSS